MFDQIYEEMFACVYEVIEKYVKLMMMVIMMMMIVWRGCVCETQSLVTVVSVTSSSFQSYGVARYQS